MQELARQVMEYIRANPTASCIIALIAGPAAIKTVSRDIGGGWALYVIVGGLGFFAGQMIIVYFGLLQYMENVMQMRLLFDFMAAYLGAFFIAALIHFVKPI